MSGYIGGKRIRLDELSVRYPAIMALSGIDWVIVQSGGGRKFVKRCTTLRLSET